MGNTRLRSGAVVVHCLDLQLVESKRGRSRHNKLGVVGYGHRGPVEVSGLLPPHDFVTKARAVGLEAVERLQRTESFLNYLFFPAFISQRPSTNGHTAHSAGTRGEMGWIIG